MVQVFNATPTPSSASMIGNALGTGLSRNVALSNLENSMQSVGNDPVKLASAFMRAGMAIPGSERFLGQMYEQALARMGNQQLGENLGTGLSNQNNMIQQNTAPNANYEEVISPKGVIPNSNTAPSNASQENQQFSIENTLPISKGKVDSPEEIKANSHQLLMDLRPDLIEGSSQWGQIPTFNYQEKSDLRPEEEAQIRQDLTNKKIMPQTQERIIENLRNDIKTRYKEKLTNFGLDQTRQNQITEKMNQFRELADKNLMPLLGKYHPTFGFGGKPRTANDLKNKYFQYAGNLPVNLTPEQMHSQAGAMLQNDINRIDALQAIPELPFIRDPNQIADSVKDLKKAYEPLLKEGFLESIKEDAASKDMGPEELHQALWGDQTDRGSLKSIADLKPAQMYIEGHSPWNMYGDNKIINPNYTKEREPYIKNLSSRLQKIKKDDDLILLRGQVLANGGLERDFNDALDQAQENGLVLSPFQERQLQEVRIPRERPIHEIFMPSAWVNWIKNFAGKR